MNFFSIAINNIRKKFTSYLMYLISTIFSVTIFNIFCSIYYNPQFSNYRFGAGKISLVFKASAIAVILFSSVFVLYSNKCFMRTRKKEMAIYSLLGMRKGQIGRMMFYENMIMGILALICGVVLGVFFSRFFTMILLHLMAAGTKVSLSFSWQSVLITVIAFLILFTCNSLNAYGIIYRNKLIDLLSANKEGDRVPSYSIIGGVFSLVLIAAGYIMSMVINVNQSGFKLLLPGFIIVILVTLGTLLFFKNFIPMIMIKLRNNKIFYYQTDHIISISQILYRIKANSRVLSVIAISSAIAITAMSVTYSMYRTLEGMVVYYSPFSYMCKDIDDSLYQQVLKTVDQVGEVEVTSVDQFQLVKAMGQNDEYTTEGSKSPGKEFDTFILSESAYKSIITDTKVKTGKFDNTKTDFTMNLKDDECFFIDGNVSKEYCENLTGDEVKVSFLNSENSYKIAGVSLHKYVGLFDLYQKPTLVVSDAIYEEYRSQADANALVSFTGLMFDKPKQSVKTVDALNKIVPVNEVTNDVNIPNISFIGFYKSIFSFYGAYVFIIMFIGILFLLASGSIMYYKQIIEAQEEVKRYDILKKTGMKMTEVRRSVEKQLGIVFGMSLFIGVMHALFALLTYLRTMDLAGKDPKTLLNALLIVAVYIVIYGFFYVLSVKSYMRIVWGKTEQTIPLPQ